MKRIITLTTDFGLKDHYVGVMKGVILSINPDVIIVDITHEIPPQDIFRASFTLRNFYRYFPPGTIHIVVVDPEVGSGRKPIALEADNHIFVGPDNGIFTFIYSEVKSVKPFKISSSKYTLPEVSSTFHGRDIFAPVAAHLSLGLSIEWLGKKVKEPVKLPINEPEVSDGKIAGEVIYIDSFGNLVTNIPDYLVKPKSWVYIGDEVIKGISKSYADVPKGELLAVIGSGGFVEISVNQGSASELIFARRGSQRLKKLNKMKNIPCVIRI
jgi:S-adenosylmethionine hydrolase